MSSTKSVTELNVGDKVAAHGAVFEIISTGAGLVTCDCEQYDPNYVGVCSVAVPVGRWLSGETVPGYFGPGKDWKFQGNHRHTVTLVAA